ncbi:prepilin-type N-terminal cleavage/methylation domain-containing protein [Paenibacillus sp. Z6-24]
MLSKVMKKMGKEEKGFTLIELLAVIVILAIIAVIAIPLIGNVINKSKTNGDLNTASQIYNAARMYVIDTSNGDFKTAGTVSLTNLVDGGYLDKGIALPSSKKKITKADVVFTSTGQLDSVTITPAPEGSAAGKYTAAQVLAVDKDATDTATKVETPTPTPAGGS